MVVLSNIMQRAWSSPRRLHVGVPHGYSPPRRKSKEDSIQHRRVRHVTHGHIVTRGHFATSVAPRTSSEHGEFESLGTRAGLRCHGYIMALTSAAPTGICEKTSYGSERFCS